MGVTLYDMLADEHESTMPVGKAAVKLRSIDPELISPATLATVAYLEKQNLENVSIQAGAPVMLKLAEVVTDLVIAWEFVAPDGSVGPLLGKNQQPVHLVKEEVATLPAKFLWMVIEHITSGSASVGETQPGKRTERTSGATSSAQAKSGISQSGTRRSEPPNISAYRRGTFSRKRNRNGNAGRGPRS